MSNVSIGTSGWVYPHWKGHFYPDDLPEDKWLEFYADHFSAVELNASFYSLPKAKTFLNWYERTPPGFIFTVKGSRFITHMKRLQDCRRPLDNLIQAVDHLREKLGPIFFQLPPSFKADSQRLERFLKFLPSGHRFAFEFRHPSWFDDEIYAILRGANCALVVSDTPRYPYEEVSTADFTYTRLHGRKRLYASHYSRLQLEEYAGKVRGWSKGGDVFVFFDNDAEANAVTNAKELRELISHGNSSL